MTCVVAILERGRVYMGADSLISQLSGDCVWTSTRPKITRYGRALVGWAGTLHHAQAVDGWFRRRGVRAKDLREGRYIDGLRKWIKAREPGNFETDHLIATDGHLFELDSNLGVVEQVEPFAAIGSGSDLALGVLFATSGRPARERIERALEAAERFTSSCRRPWQLAEAPAVRTTS